MITLILLLFLPAMALSSTWTVIVPDIVPPTTYQVLLDGINQLSTDTDKIEEIGKELVKNPDVITGQLLTNYKAYLEVEVKHKRQGRNYFGYIHCPVYKEK